MKISAVLVGVGPDAQGAGVAPGSRNAALRAADVAQRTGASVILFRSGFEGDGGVAETVDTGSLEKLRSELEARGVATELRFSDERPWLEMIRIVQDGDADLVMVAKRDVDDGDGRNLGSNAVKLIRKCPAPVWLVRQPALSRVLAATDLSDVGQRAVRHASFLADLFGASLDVVHAYQIPMDVQLTHSEEQRDARLAEIEQAARDAITAAVAEAAFSGRAQIHVGCTSPSIAIRTAVERFRADLLVMGSMSHTGVAGMLLGSTAERVLDRIACSLLTIKPSDFVSPVPRRPG